MDFSSDAKGSTSKKKDKMNIDNLEDSQHGNQEFIGNKKNDDVKDHQVANNFGKVDCSTGIIVWSFTLGPWEAVVLKLIILFFLAGCLAFLVMKLFKEGRVLSGKDVVGKKA